MSDKVRNEIEVFKRGLLAGRLERCTEEQRESFYQRIFPKERFPDGVPDKFLMDAIDLCDRTIQTNESAPSCVEAKP